MFKQKFVLKVKSALCENGENSRFSEEKLLIDCYQTTEILPNKDFFFILNN